MRPPSTLLLALVTLGCTQVDARDAGHRDVSILHDARVALDADAVTLDAPGLDAPELDAPMTMADASRDAPVAIPDAGSAGPHAACSGPGGAGHVQLVAAYWARTEAFGDHLDELAPAMQAGHVDVPGLARPLPDGVDVIVDLHWELFDYATHTLRADFNARLDVLEAAMRPHAARVRALYLIDEPYVVGHEIPRPVLEAAITALHTRFPSMPTYITFAHHCFDPASTDAVCVVPSTLRGIPAGLDWVGFDWYNDSNDLAVAGTHVGTHIAPGVARIRSLSPSARIVLVPESYTDTNRTEGTARATLYDYFALANESPDVYGVDFFLWADAPSERFLGARSLPTLRSASRAFARWVRAGCGEPPSLIPVTQWYASAGPDYRYEPWVWNGRASGYRVDAVAFALPPVGTPGTLPLLHCLVERGASVDSMLTLDAACEGAPLRGPSSVIGGVFTTAQPGTVQLHRYGMTVPPWDHLYTLSATLTVPGYAYEYPVGWVYPAEAL